MMVRTSDMLLFRCGLLWTGRLFDIYDKLMLSLLLVDRPSWKVDIIAVDVECILASPTHSETKVSI